MIRFPKLIIHSILLIVVLTIMSLFGSDFAGWLLGKPIEVGSDFLKKEEFKMNKYRGYAMMSGFLGAFLIATGMMLKNIVTYSPSIGWIGGTVLFFAATYFAIKSNKSNAEMTS